MSTAFKVQAISLYPGSPDRSMALIAEAASPDEVARWVKKGSQIGVWVVQEVRRGMVVVRNGEQVREVTVERSAMQRTLVKDVKQGTRVSLVQSHTKVDSGLVDGDRRLIHGNEADVNDGR
jgi:hypothetical protein